MFALALPLSGQVRSWPRHNDLAGFAICLPIPSQYTPVDADGAVMPKLVFVLSYGIGLASVRDTDCRGESEATRRRKVRGNGFRCSQIAVTVKAPDHSFDETDRRKVNSTEPVRSTGHKGTTAIISASRLSLTGDLLHICAPLPSSRNITVRISPGRIKSELGSIHESRRCHASRPLSCKKRTRGQIRRKMRTMRTQRKSTKWPIFYELIME